MTTAVTTAPDVLPALMNEEEAKEAVAGIKRSIGNLRAKLVELDEREGWKALGYASIEACCEKEFGWKKSHLYRQPTAGAIEKAIGSPLGTERESHLRPLAGKPREVQRRAFAEAKRDGAPTAERVRRAVERIEHPATTTRSEPSPLITGLVTQNEPEPEPLVSGSVAIVEPQGQRQTVTIDAPTPVSEASELVNQQVARSRVEIPSPYLLSELGEIEAAVLKRHGLSVGRAAGLFSQILAAAEQGGASWEARLKGACRTSFK